MFKLTEKQQEIVDSNARIKLVMGANRSGKTITAISNIWEQMKQKNDTSFKAIYLVRTMPTAKMITREIKYIISDKNFLITEKEDYFIVRTSFGEIYVSTKPINLDFENKTIDEASSNKYVGSSEFWKGSENANICITGHLPDNVDNDFFKLWLYGLFINTSDIKSFRLEHSHCDIVGDKETELIKFMGINRYVRQYCAMPLYFHWNLVMDINE